MLCFQNNSMPCCYVISNIVKHIKPCIITVKIIIFSATFVTCYNRFITKHLCHINHLTFCQILSLVSFHRLIFPIDDTAKLLDVGISKLHKLLGCMQIFFRCYLRLLCEEYRIVHQFFNHFSPLNINSYYINRNLNCASNIRKISILTMEEAVEKLTT